MANCNDNKNPLQRSGISQPQRLLPGLDPSSAPLVDKDPLDWMVWGSRLAQNLRYYDNTNNANGSMEPFFGADIAARLAMVATNPLDTISDFTREQLLILYDNSNSSRTALLRKTFTSLFDVLFGYLQRVDAVQQQMTDFENRYPGMLSGIDFPYQLSNHINLRLLAVAGRALSYFKAAKNVSLTDVTSAGVIDVFNQPIATADSVIATGLEKPWWQGNASWNDWVNSVAEEPSLFGSETTIAGKIQHAAHHNFFTGLLDEVSSSAAFLASTAAIAVKKLLGEWPNHQPQYALFLAWLQLMENARNSINQLTARHLEYYYERVLRLQKHAPVADSAFLSLELNKGVTTSALLKGTAFIGGKDSKGTDIMYTALRETVLNKAKVEQLQSIYLADAHDVLNGVNMSGQLYASPIANSKDGLGKKLDTPLQEWHPFYGKTYNNGSLQSIDMPKAEVGFAIASHYLRLKEGKRKITLSLDVNSEAQLIGKKVSVWLTTGKGWLDAGILTFAAGKMQDGFTNGAVLTFTIGADKPAISGYVSKTHGFSFTTTEPVMRLMLPNSNTSAVDYNQWLNLQLNRADLFVQVGEVTGAYNAEGLKSLQLNNDAGPLDASKPFQPFGNEPTPGNALIIGSDELFSKPNAVVQLNLEWKDLPANSKDIAFEYDSTADYQSIASTNISNYYPEIDIQTLEAGAWQTKGAKQNLFPLSGSKPLANAVFKTSSALAGNLFLHAEEAYPAFNATANRGFMRVKLRQDFGHRNYRNAHTNYLIEKGKSNPNAVEPAAPYNPVLQSLILNYNAVCSITAATSLNALPMQWIHIAPFGDAQQHKDLTGTPLFLVPQLTAFSNPAKAQGCLLIGLSGVSSGETISLLFQLMEGSENPLQAKPANHITWQFLSSNQWKNFDTNTVDDGTAQFIRSGIIHFTLPESITSKNTLQQSGLLWLRAKVNEAPDAVCKVIGIHTNAIEVQRSLAGGSVMEKLVAPAGSISKMQMPDGKVKKATQPYASFGGKPLEGGNAYYIRVSERLRHKDRAITIWDYERLVLQQFPEIYKVKCLNHTKLTGSVAEGNMEYNEVAPGYVTIITIPNLQQRNDADPLKPYTKKSTLDAIETYLKARTSCHVKLTAAQPQFEEIRMAATVVLADGYNDAVFYKQQLQQELTEYLSPWAFGRAGNIDFGGSIHKSVLIDFMEERPYVDFLTDVQLFHKPGETAVESGDMEEVIASTARSVLVSAAAYKHLFTVLTHKEIPAPKPKC